MRRIYQALVLVKNFATGVMAPVLTLMLMARGASIGQVSLALGVYSFTVIAMEFPSGVYADLRGRKRAFLLSAALNCLCYGLLFAASSPALLFLAMAACGLGRAFASGSIEALAIDEAADAESGSEDGALIKVSARLSILESLGLAAGALAGGWMAGFGAKYQVNLTVNLALYAALFLLALMGVREAKRPRAVDVSAHCRTGWLDAVRALVRESLRFAAQPGAVRMLFALSLITGFALVALETYWQPALAAFSPGAWVFGVVSFAGFCAVMLGSRAMARVLPGRRDGGVRLLLGLKAGMGPCLMLTAFQTRAPLFILAYALCYLLLGGGGVAESALLNRAAPPGQRASILSLYSFTAQTGGLAASITGSLVSTAIGFTSMWWISGALLILGAGAFFRARRLASASSGAPQ